MTGAFALALLGLLEAYAIARTLAARVGEPVRPNDELFAQGLTNALSSLFHCIPGSGSFSRSALNHSAGAATQFSGVWLSVWVVVASSSTWSACCSIASTSCAG